MTWKLGFFAAPCHENMGISGVPTLAHPDEMLQLLGGLLIS